MSEPGALNRSFCVAHRVRAVGAGDKPWQLVVKMANPGDAWAKERIEGTMLCEVVARSATNAELEAIEVADDAQDPRIELEVDHALCEVLRVAPLRRKGGEVEVAALEAAAASAKRGLERVLGWTVRTTFMPALAIAHMLQRHARRDDASSEKDALELLARTWRMPLAEIPKGGGKTLGREDAVVVDEATRSIVVATCNPQDPALIEQARAKYGKEVLLALASPRAVRVAALQAS
jgi:hypothetical protein